MRSGDPAQNEARPDLRRFEIERCLSFGADQMRHVAQGKDAIHPHEEIAQTQVGVRFCVSRIECDGLLEAFLGAYP